MPGPEKLLTLQKPVQKLKKLIPDKCYEKSPNKIWWAFTAGTIDMAARLAITIADTSRIVYLTITNWYN